MRNITTDDFRFGMLCITTMLTFITLAAIGAFYFDGKSGHNFDINCVNNGKSLVYESLEGQDYAKKMCK